MYEELVNKRVKVVLKVEIAPNRPLIYEGLLLSEGTEYIHITDKYSKTQFISKDQIATIGEVNR